MKLIASAVAKSAPIRRSPSFSRSSSSTRTTIRPALISAMISMMGAMGIRALRCSRAAHFTAAAHLSRAIGSACRHA